MRIVGVAGTVSDLGKNLLKNASFSKNPNAQSRYWSLRWNNRPEGPRELSPGFSLGLCVDFKAGLRSLGARVHEKSAAKLRDF
jgi:hypothetical protein